MELKVLIDIMRDSFINLWAQKMALIEEVRSLFLRSSSPDQAAVWQEYCRMTPCQDSLSLSKQSPVNLGQWFKDSLISSLLMAPASSVPVQQVPSVMITVVQLILKCQIILFLMFNGTGRIYNVLKKLHNYRNMRRLKEQQIIMLLFIHFEGIAVEWCAVHVGNIPPMTWDQVVVSLRICFGDLLRCDQPLTWVSLSKDKVRWLQNISQWSLKSAMTLTHKCQIRLSRFNWQDVFHHIWMR